MDILDLCSGIGGFRLGMGLSDVAPANINFVAYSDIDPYANRAYEAMFDCENEISLGDIQRHTRFEGENDLVGRLLITRERDELIEMNIPNIDILFAGFPCQPHSLMGNRRGNQDDRGNLFYDIAEILRIKQPAYFILENVRALESVNGGAFFSEIMEVLENELHYNVKVLKLNASDFGIPQTRRRLFIVGSLERNIENIGVTTMPLANAIFPTTWHLLEREVDEKYFLSQRILETILRHQHGGYNRPAIINKLIARPLTKSMHKMHRASQDNYYSLDFIHGNYNPALNTVILDENQPLEIRRITPREALRIQCFPEAQIDALLNAGLSDTRLYMLAGNAVPPLMVAAVINSLFENHGAVNQIN